MGDAAPGGLAASVAPTWPRTSTNAATSTAARRIIVDLPLTAGDVAASPSGTYRISRIRAGRENLRLRCSPGVSVAQPHQRIFGGADRGFVRSSLDAVRRSSARELEPYRRSST